MARANKKHKEILESRHEMMIPKELDSDFKAYKGLIHGKHLGCFSVRETFF